MQSTNIIVYRGKNFFGVPIIAKTMSFAIKFDTGASNTVLSIDKIWGDKTLGQLSGLKSFIEKKTIAPKEFQSASGHSFLAYPACMENVIIGSYMFEKFYYYLVIEKLHNDRQIALLGDDFIDCCGFEKNPHGNIVISQFDFSSYKIETNSLSTEEILSIF